MSASSNTERYRGKPWKLLAVTTGNARLVEKIGIIKAMPKAEAQRIMECRVKTMQFDTKEDTDDLRNSPTIDIYNQLLALNINTMIYDHLIKSEEYLSIEDFEKLEGPHLIALMYPVKEDLMSKINNIVSKSNSSLYTPWQL